MELDLESFARKKGTLGLDQIFRFVLNILQWMTGLAVLGYGGYVTKSPTLFWVFVFFYATFASYILYTFSISGMRATIRLGIQRGWLVFLVGFTVGVVTSIVILNITATIFSIISAELPGSVNPLDESAIPLINYLFRE